MRTAYFWDPYTITCATPSTMEMRCAMIVWPYSSSADSDSVGLVRAYMRTGASAAFCLLYEGGAGMFAGSWRAARAIAACTSCAAASMSRFMVNCRVICVEPCMLVEFIVSMPAMVENCFSSGVATAAAMVSGLAPGMFAETEIVG